MTKVSDDVAAYGIGFEVDGARVDPKRVRIHYPPGYGAPNKMRLPCEKCGRLHIDKGVFATKPHHTHSCQFCGHTWRPAKEHTTGVKFIPGFRDAPSDIEFYILQSAVAIPDFHTTWKPWRFFRCPVYQATWRLYRSGDLELTWRLKWNVTDQGRDWLNQNQRSA